MTRATPLIQTLIIDVCTEAKAAQLVGLGQYNTKGCRKPVLLINVHRYNYYALTLGSLSLGNLALGGPSFFQGMK